MVLHAPPPAHTHKHECSARADTSLVHVCARACVQGAGKSGTRGSALDGIGAAGHMGAGAGGSSYDQSAGGSGRRMEFKSGGR